MFAVRTPLGGGKHPLKTRLSVFFTPRRGRRASPSQNRYCVRFCPTHPHAGASSRPQAGPTHIVVKVKIDG